MSHIKDILAAYPYVTAYARVVPCRRCYGYAVCVSHFLLHQLSERLAKFSHLGPPEPWISQAITAFADDFLASFDLNNQQDLTNMCVPA